MNSLENQFNPEITSDFYFHQTYQSRKRAAEKRGITRSEEYVYSHTHGRAQSNASVRVDSYSFKQQDKGSWQM